MVKTIDEEIALLKDRGFAQDDMKPSMLVDDFHTKKIWADAFWRRRSRHAQRVDPEIIFIQQRTGTNFPQTLEIGAAYGRVSVKLEQLEKIGMVTSCEICGHLEPYSKKYIEKNEQIRFVYDDFLKTSSIDDHAFDLVVMPMNTLPSFSPKQLPMLLQKVHQVLKPGGIFLFTTYPDRQEPRVKERYEGELLVEEGELPLAIEYYTLPETKITEGIASTTYAKFRYLHEDTVMTEPLCVRLRNHIYRHDYLAEMLEQHHLTVKFQKQIDHSTVFVGEAQ